MLGRNPGYVTSQGQIAADLFALSGYRVCSSSSRINRLVRLVDMIRTLLKQRNDIDVLLVEVYSGPSFIVADIISFLGRRFSFVAVGVLHGGNLPNFSKKFPVWSNRVFRRFDVLVAPSPYLAREMSLHGLTARVIPNIIDLPSYPFRLRTSLRPRMLWMRAFHEIYNPMMALQVLAKIREKYPEATLVMAGADKGLECDIKRAAQDMGLGSSVEFPGFLGAEEKMRAFMSADIYLNTNKIDNMPVTVVEACAVGIPVVSTDVGGISDLIADGETGLLVPDDDDAEMSRKVLRLLEDTELAGKLSRNGRLLAERSAWMSVRKCWDKVFAELTTSTRIQHTNASTDSVQTTS